jgi:3-hydroxyacyl-[acyl-carrier-protein] dehydratase
MTLAEIHALIPHRSPMLLLDEIVERTDELIVCRKTFHADEFFFQGHYPGVILCEAAMQAGAVLLARHVTEGGGVPVATRLNEVKFKRMIRPDDTVLLEAKIVERIQNAFFLTAKVTCQGKLAASLEFACTLADPAKAT